MSTNSPRDRQPPAPTPQDPTTAWGNGDPFADAVRAAAPGQMPADAVAVLKERGYDLVTGMAFWVLGLVEADDV